MIIVILMSVGLYEFMFRYFWLDIGSTETSNCELKVFLPPMGKIFSSTFQLKEIVSFPEGRVDSNIGCVFLELKPSNDLGVYYFSGGWIRLEKLEICTHQTSKLFSISCRMLPRGFQLLKLLK